MIKNRASEGEKLQTYEETLQDAEYKGPFFLEKSDLMWPCEFIDH